MRGRPGHAHSQSLSGAVNQKAQLANAYQELAKELASERIKVVGNYTLGKVIGEGAYGKVRIGTHRLTSTRVAIKHIPKDLSASLTREIHHHRRLHHPNVTQLYEVIATESSIWLITELCSGGELYDYLVEKGRLSELETRRIFGELCLALHYVHSQGVVHRDLKLENVLLDERCHVKLSDFGFTREFEHNRLMETYCGTTGYAAPEMLQCKKYTGAEVDVWSLGVILYCLLVGTLPFDDEDEEVMKHKIIYEDYEDPEFLSEDVRDLIRNLLQKNPAKRLSVSQILAHPWFSRPMLEEPDNQPLSPPDAHVIDLTDEAGNANPSTKQRLDPISIPDVPDAQTSPSTSSRTHHSRDTQPSASSVTSDATFHSATSGLSQSDEGNDLPATPADSSGSHDFARTADSVEGSTDEQTGETQERAGEPSVYMHRMESQSTIRKPMSEKASPVDSSHSHAPTVIPTTVPEEDSTDSDQKLDGLEDSDAVPAMHHSALPPAGIRTRTPVRTKRRSVSSNLTNSPPSSPTISPPPLVPLGGTSLPDFQAQSHVKAPLAFSTELERNLLSTLSMMGLDTGQIVHSVLTDACDSASALWWMLKKKAERREILEARKQAERAKAAAALEDRKPPAVPPKNSTSRPKPRDKDALKEERELPPLVESPQPIAGTASKGKGTPISTTGSTPEPSLASKNRPPVALMLGQGASASNPSTLGSGPSAPDVTFIPPTPVTLSHDTSATHTPDSGRRTPPPSGNSFPFNLSVHLQSPGSGSSVPSTPERERGSKRGTKPRAGSITMLQRATTALSAAGLTRKKSGEAIKEDGLPASSSSTGSTLRASASTEDTRPSSSGSHSNKLTKSPPNAKDKERERDPQALPPLSMNDLHRITHVPSDMTPGSPWAFPEAPPSKIASAIPAHIPYRHSVQAAPTPANSPGGSLSNVPGFGKGSGSTGSTVKVRNRASLLAAFRTWFYEDKRKRKKAASNLATIPDGVPSSHPYSYGTAGASPRTAYANNSVKSNRPKRPSVSSRRSSSVNSRRSSLNSIHPPPLAASAISNNHLSRQRSDASRRSLGTRTPTSERDLSSRPSSVRSFTMTPMTPGPRVKRHSKSSSASSGGSATPAPGSRKAASPMQYHRRANSGSSTRVLRQVKTVGGRPNHIRSDSQASSIHSRASSRPGSFHESDAEGFPRSGSPMMISRRSSEENRGQFNTTTVMVAHRKSSLFGPPSASGRSSWKKSWGNEPPTWSSRSLQSPQELPVDPSRPNIRDVFATRSSLSAGDESDWVDEDDDEPAFLGGLGQPAHGLGQGPSTNNPRPAPLVNIAASSAPQPGSPSLKKMDLPPLAGMRNRPAPPPNRNSRPSSYKASELGRHTKNAPTSSIESVQEETTVELADASSSARSRRQLPAGRSGPAFRQAIQEEDEDEEEE